MLYARDHYILYRISNHSLRISNHSLTLYNLSPTEYIFFNFVKSFFYIQLVKFCQTACIAQNINITKESTKLWRRQLKRHKNYSICIRN